MDLILGIGILALAWQWRNGWPSLSTLGQPPVSSQPSTVVVSGQPSPVSSGTAPVIDSGGGGSRLVNNDPVALGGGTSSFNPAAVANYWADYINSIPVGDPGGAHNPTSPYAPGVINVGGGGTTSDNLQTDGAEYGGFVGDMFSVE